MEEEEEEDDDVDDDDDDDNAAISSGNNLLNNLPKKSTDAHVAKNVMILVRSPYKSMIHVP